VAIFHVIPAGDLELSATGDFVWIEGPAQIRQRIAARLKFWLGEYFLDVRQGVPYLRDVLVKNPDLNVIDSLFRRIVLSTPGVLSLSNFAIRFERAERRIYVTFHAKVEGGVVIVRPGDDDFIIGY
jgi:hypothetical protein